MSKQIATLDVATRRASQSKVYMSNRSVPGTTKHRIGTKIIRSRCQANLISPKNERRCWSFYCDHVDRHLRLLRARLRERTTMEYIPVKYRPKSKARWVDRARLTSGPSQSDWQRIFSLVGWPCRVLWWRTRATLRNRFVTDPPRKSKSVSTKFLINYSFLSVCWCAGLR